MMEKNTAVRNKKARVCFPNKRNSMFILNLLNVSGCEKCLTRSENWFSNVLRVDHLLANARTLPEQKSHMLTVNVLASSQFTGCFFFIAISFCLTFCFYLNCDMSSSHCMSRSFRYQNGTPSIAIWNAQFSVRCFVFFAQFIFHFNRSYTILSLSIGCFSFLCGCL